MYYSNSNNKKLVESGQRLAGNKYHRTSWILSSTLGCVLVSSNTFSILLQDTSTLNKPLKYSLSLIQFRQANS